MSEYHPRGTLHDNPELFKGDVLGALRAFEPLVAAIDKLHHTKAIHRDIKPENVYVAENGELVLGDFGIIFWTDGQQRRWTETYERVGTRDWMAPWANRSRRLAEVNTTFDLFPLGKLLWSMISGQPELPFWYWNRDAFNLETLFPEKPDVGFIGRAILAHTVVEEEKDCFTSAGELLLRVRALIVALERGAQNINGPNRPCRVCGQGSYQPFRGNDTSIMLMVPEARIDQAVTPHVFRNQELRMTARAQVCDQCGHVDFFHFPDGRKPKSWLS